LPKFLDSHQLLCKEQHGFSSGRSCLTNLLETLKFNHNQHFGDLPPVLSIITFFYWKWYEWYLLF